MDTFETLESLFMSFRKCGNTFVQAAKKSITDPYRSTRVFWVDWGS
ncbi:MAG: hypothetical protein ACYCPR_03005 [Thermoplasmataceae archaeon]